MVRVAAVYSAALFLLNAVLIRRLFVTEYLNHMYSVEGSFIAISRMMLQAQERLWWPWWNLGMPYENAYLPALPALSAALSATTGWSPALSYHAVIAFMYCAGAVTLFWLAWRLTGEIHAAFFAGLAHSLLSPAAMLIPAIRDDAGGFWAAQRMRSLVFYGEGPHIVALAIWPLAILLLHNALDKRTRLRLTAAGVAIAAVGLTNAFGAVALALGIVCLLAARAQWRRDLPLVAAIGVISYLAAAPWLPPSFLQVIRENARPSQDPTLWPRAGTAVVCVLAWWIAHRWKSTGLRFFAIYATLFTLVSILGNPFGIRVLPQGERYHLEMEMALCLMVPALLAKVPGRARYIVAGSALVLACVQVYRYAGLADRLIQPVKVEQTIEHRTAVAMRDLVNGERVMVTGSPALWFNAFTEVPQLYGGHEPFNPNWSTMVAAFTIFTGTNAGSRDAEVCILWLKALGAHAINVSGPASPEPYKIFRRNFQIFEGKLPVLHRDGGDTIYRVPQRTGGIAHVVPRQSLVQKRPIHGLDVDQIRTYVQALDDVSLPPASVDWEAPHRGLIRAHLEPGQVVSIQTTFHRGWKARVDGAERRTIADGLGMLAIEPDCLGDCKIVLEYDGGAEAAVVLRLSQLTLLIVGLWCAAGAVRMIRQR